MNLDLMLIAGFLFPGVLILGMVFPPMQALAFNPRFIFVLLFSAVFFAVLGLQLNAMYTAAGTGFSIFMATTVLSGKTTAIPITAIVGLITGLYFFFNH